MASVRSTRLRPALLLLAVAALSVLLGAAHSARLLRGTEAANYGGHGHGHGHGHGRSFGHSSYGHSGFGHSRSYAQSYSHMLYSHSPVTRRAVDVDRYYYTQPYYAQPYSSYSRSTYSAPRSTPCSPNPCLNGGWCSTRYDGTALCHCGSSYAGDLCEVEL